MLSTPPWSTTVAPLGSGEASASVPTVVAKKPGMPPLLGEETEMSARLLMTMYLRRAEWRGGTGG